MPEEKILHAVIRKLNLSMKISSAEKYFVIMIMHALKTDTFVKTMYKNITLFRFETHFHLMLIL